MNPVNSDIGQAYRGVLSPLYHIGPQRSRRTRMTNHAVFECLNCGHLIYGRKAREFKYLVQTTRKAMDDMVEDCVDDFNPERTKYDLNPIILLDKMAMCCSSPNYSYPGSIPPGQSVISPYTINMYMAKDEME